MLRMPSLRSRIYWKNEIFSGISVKKRHPHGARWQPCTSIYPARLWEVRRHAMLFQPTEILKKSCLVHVCTEPPSKQSGKLFDWIVKSIPIWSGKYSEARQEADGGHRCYAILRTTSRVRANDFQFLTKPAVRLSEQRVDRTCFIK